MMAEIEVECLKTDYLGTQGKRSSERHWKTWSAKRQQGYAIRHALSVGTLCRSILRFHHAMYGGPIVLSNDRIVLCSSSGSIDLSR